MKKISVVGTRRADGHFDMNLITGDSGGQTNDWNTATNVMRLHPKLEPLIFDETAWDNNYWDE